MKKVIKKILFLTLSIIVLVFVFSKITTSPVYAAGNCGDPANVDQQYWLANCAGPTDSSNATLVVIDDPNCDAQCAAQQYAAGMTQAEAQGCAEAGCTPATYMVTPFDGGFLVTCSNNNRRIIYRNKNTPTPPPTGPPPTNPPTQPPSCGQPCSDSNFCLTQNVGTAQNCTQCVIPTGATTGTCLPPVITPTPPAQCNSQCTTDIYCQSGNSACDVCVVPTGSTTGTCQTRPTPTVTPPPPTPTFTPVPPTPTPIPPKPTCDGIAYSPAQMKSGQNETISSFAVVEGPNPNLTKITSQSFFLTQGADNTHGQIIAQSGPVPARVISSSSNKVRYQSDWTFKFPQLVSGNTYRIWSTISYAPANSAYNLNQQVAGISTKNETVVDKLVAFVRGIFGAKTEDNIAIIPTSAPKMIIVANSTGATVLAAQSQSLQLGTVNPVEVTFKGCDAIKLRYNF